MNPMTTPKQNPDPNRELRPLLRQLLSLIERRGVRSEEVRQFILANGRVTPDAEETFLAAVLVVEEELQRKGVV